MARQVYLPQSDCECYYKALEALEEAIAPFMAQKQDLLISGENLKTIDGNSLLGSGDLVIDGLPAVTSADDGKVLRVVNGEWAAASLPVAAGVSF